MFGRCLTLAAGLILFLPGQAGADAKEGMPDLCQVDNTCLPTSTAQLLIWFSRNGYPQLLPEGITKDDRYLALVHKLMTDTSARFDWGTDPDLASGGITNYVHSVGYGCNVVYRGLSGPAFDPGWLNENNEPDSGFILLLQYVQYNNNDTFSNVLNMGHAVTLISYDPETMIIEDTAHLDSEPGRKMLSFLTLTHGRMVGGAGESVPVKGLVLLSGSLLRAPENSMVMVIGALRIKMYRSISEESGPSPASPMQTLTGGAASPGMTPTSTPPKTKSWLDLLFDWLLGS